MNLFLTIALILLFAYSLGKIGKKLKIPEVVCLILSGLILNLGVLREWFVQPHTQFYDTFANIGLFALMILAGLQSSPKELYLERKDAMLIAVFASFLPVILGIIVFKLMGFSFITAATIGICSCITAEATKARVLMDLKKIRSRLAAALLAAGVADDFIGLFLFIGLTYIIHAVKIVEYVYVFLAILAFFVGILIQKYIGSKNKLVNKGERIMLWIIIPLFFVSVGIKFDVHSLMLNPWVVIAIIIVAFIGKMVGSLLTKPFTKLSWKQLYLVGWSMNSRGAVELVIALIALRAGILSTELYSGVVLMALVTTLVFPFMMEHLINKNPKIMN